MEELKVYCPTCGHLISDCSSIEDIKKKLEVLGKVHINYSEITNKFYVTMNPSVEIGDDSILCSPSEHQATPEKAIQAYFERITNLKWDEYLVINGNSPREIHYKYKNNKFELIRQNINSNG